MGSVGVLTKTKKVGRPHSSIKLQEEGKTRKLTKLGKSKDG